jgi:predicted CXXCH cytochrome family protein
VTPARPLLSATLALAALLAAAPLRVAAAPAVAGARSRVAASKHAAVRRDPRHAPGACLQCHGGNRRRGTGAERSTANDLCVECHRSPLPGSSFQGSATYDRSAHGGPGSVAWPGPKPSARRATSAGACVTCHDPHGAVDANGPIPAMRVVRGEALCLACHGGVTRTDVAAQFRKPYRHGSPSGPGAVACADCHNPHLVRADAGAPRAPDASARLAGIERVRVANGTAGAPPVYARVDATDPSPVLEYEVCFKCHSGFAAQRRPGSPDLAVLLNPANASFHPVEAAGRNRNVDFRAFAARWTADRLVLCSDCHGSDDPGAAGVHGSNERWLLRARYVAGPGPQRALSTDLCFRCHAYATYADPAGGAAWAYSRFRLHAPHASAGAGCFGCHESHGSATAPALVAVGRAPGMPSYAQTAMGGSCVATCHVRSPASATYTVAYPR